MHTVLLSVALALIPFAAPAPDARPLKLGKEVKLFSGKDLAGWTFHLADPNAKMADTWFVDTQEKVLICRGQPAGYVRTVKDYGNFVLTLQWRWNPETKQAGNSGVLLRVVGEDKVWPKSIEAQLMSGAAGDFWLIDGARLTTPVERIDPGAQGHRIHLRANEKPVGEWNTYEIVCNGGTVTLKVNGVVLNAGTDADLLTGKVALQSEGAEIHFRNVVLRPILR